MKGGLRIGITIGLHQADESLWTNGIKQNAVFLAEALRHCPEVTEVMLVNTTDIPITSALPWDLVRYPTVTFDMAKDAVDVLIELGGQIGPEQTEYLKQNGTRLVSYCCGSEYVAAMESILFRKPVWGYPFVNQRYDDIWVIPQVAVNSLAYFEVLRRQTCHIVPFVWSPMFLEHRTRDWPHGGVYQARAGAKRLSVMEPNLNIVKFCLYPILIAELAYREQPDRIALLQVCNAEPLAKESAEFIGLMNQLDIVRTRRAIFVGRYDTPAFLADCTDVVISHQLENPLNYLYLEVCWQGYPFVHNAVLCRDLGYFYPSHHVKEGARQLIRILQSHDAHADEYRVQQRARIARFLPHMLETTATYSRLLNELMSRPIR
ncbi:hypothetical protein WI87_13970 [Burkholderia ubonensis]|uniref:DUF2827 domain-containing protein n=1 Tax=Burkholderia ubonensis TaxID=101571 RepID=UPI00075CB32A|nr:DUF2827 domain-containing protein [Burkholderia ubonensis]KVD59172.1 hypothetical protein WI87_13970 [Burkholderia ubonensis]